MRTINPIQASILILRSQGRFIGIKFIKRTNGVMRTMNFRLGVRKFSQGRKMKYDPISYTLLNVWDRNKQGYRNIPLDAIREVQIDGERFLVDQMAGNRIS